MTDSSFARRTHGTASVRAAFAVLAALALCTLALAAIAFAAARVSYRGRTSQQRPISFTIAGAEVTGLRYHIDDRCPGGKVLFVNAWGFPVMQIKHSKFGGKFVGKAPQQATAIVHGSLSGAGVSGTLSDRRVDAKTHKRCSGRATFALARRRRAPGADH